MRRLLREDLDAFLQSCRQVRNSNSMQSNSQNQENQKGADLPQASVSALKHLLCAALKTGFVNQ